MEGIGLEHEAMSRGAAAVAEASELIKGHMQQLNAEVEAMMAGWSSAASRSFTTLHESWIAQQGKLHNALQGMHEALVHTHATYTHQEEEQASQFSNITAQL
ncbi:MAG: WXG100 family type VII secretion target [Actinobacteria bacterium]|nr:WXG100 family type VII secretion target [Actinomycetota bacterium]MBI3686527.1 WXG100 family type VII secretion target [Actinomycetota bacterium]